MSNSTCSVRGYIRRNEAEQCQRDLEAASQQPHRVTVAEGAAYAGSIFYQVTPLEGCHPKGAVFDGFFGNERKASECLHALERMTGVRYSMARSKSLLFSDAFRISPAESGGSMSILSRWYL